MAEGHFSKLQLLVKKVDFMEDEHKALDDRVIENKHELKDCINTISDDLNELAKVVRHQARLIRLQDRRLDDLQKQVYNLKDAEPTQFMMGFADGYGSGDNY